jgi:hypothetical protein
VQATSAGEGASVVHAFDLYRSKFFGQFTATCLNISIQFIQCRAAPVQESTLPLSSVYTAWLLIGSTFDVSPD